MLVLQRKVDQGIIIDDRIRVSLVELRSGSARIGVEAPKEVAIWRDDIGVEKRDPRIRYHNLIQHWQADQLLWVYKEPKADPKLAITCVNVGYVEIFNDHTFSAVTLVKFESHWLAYPVRPPKIFLDNFQTTS